MKYDFFRRPRGPGPGKAILTMEPLDNNAASLSGSRLAPLGPRRAYTLASHLGDCDPARLATSVGQGTQPQWQAASDLEEGKLRAIDHERAVRCARCTGP
jgi:hypothetical protein